MKSQSDTGILPGVGVALCAASEPWRGSTAPNDLGYAHVILGAISLQARAHICVITRNSTARDVPAYPMCEIDANGVDNNIME